MKQQFMALLALSTLLLGLAACGMANSVRAQDGFLTGTVERVWEDGFRLNTGDRSFRVDSWDVYGDATPRYVSEGDQLTITGEFEGGEFDAFTITSDDGTAPTAPASPSGRPVAQATGNGVSGTVERVWEDGFRLNTGDRTLTVDAWDLCGDATASFVAAGDQLTLTGEFDGGEFDAFSIMDTDGSAVCR